MTNFAYGKSKKFYSKMQKLDGKSQTNFVGNYKPGRFTLFNSTSGDASIFTKTATSRIYKKAISLPLDSGTNVVLSTINKTIIQTDSSQKGWGTHCQKI